MTPADAERKYNEEWPEFNKRLKRAVRMDNKTNILSARRALSALSIRYEDRHKKPEPSYSMKSRAEVADFINTGECCEIADATNKGATHFGKVELRILMDFIYGGEPQDDNELIVKLE